MERNTMETIAAAYTVYTMIAPSEHAIVSMDSFTEAFQNNLSYLEMNRNPANNSAAKACISEKEAETNIQRGIVDAEKTLDDKEKLLSLLDKVKKKMKSLPLLGTALVNLPTMFRLLNSYLKGEYTETPRKQLLFIVSALIYLVSPIDMIPDFIPAIGLVDDITVISACANYTKADLERYLEWRKENGLTTGAEESET